MRCRASALWRCRLPRKWQFSSVLLFGITVLTFAFMNYISTFYAGQRYYKASMSHSQSSAQYGNGASYKTTVASKKYKDHPKLKNGFDLAQYAQDVCHNSPGRPPGPVANISELIRHVYPIEPEKSIWCPVEKVASTFLRRVLYLLHHPSEKRTKTPYQVSINQGIGYKYPRLVNKNDSRITDYFKFMFVRDPYHRVLSAYIDKVFAPNPMFWDSFGKPSIQKFRKGGERMSCFHDTTFAEFIQFVVWSEQEKKLTDHHFLQATEICQPCAVNYAFIGKQENLEKDIGSIFDKFGMNASKHSLKSGMKKAAIVDAISDSIASPFYWKGTIQRCMSWEEAMKRVWRKMQMRGLIDLDIKYPFTGSTSGITQEKYIAEAKKAYELSDPGKLKKQKHSVFTNMYRSVPIQTLLAFKDVYANDFLLFDYTDRPESIFERSNEFISNNLTVIDTI